MSDMRVIALAGWSGAGKTTLLTKLIPLFVAQGLRVATLKHAHHEFDVDQPGKDSHAHRAAGASEVLISSARRWAHIREVGEGQEEATLAQLLRRLTAADLVVVEGFKREPMRKLEVFRAANGKPAMHPDDAAIVAVASDSPFPGASVPVIDLNDAAAIAQAALAAAEPTEDLLRRLERHGAA